MKDALLRAAAIANDDGEFVLAARLWSADVAFVSGNEVAGIVVRDGKLRADAAAAERATIRVSGPPEGWRLMLQTVPQPFYHDLFGAMMHHGFAIEGEMQSVYPYYAALRRFVELMRTAGEGR
jgi:hypothetical protein